MVDAYLAGLRSADYNLAVGAIAGHHTAAGHPDPTPPDDVIIPPFR